MIPDGPKCFPRSAVKWTRFHAYELQYLFACLREREEVLQTDLEKARKEDMPRLMMVKRAQLEEVERSLIWMATNATGNRAEVARRRRGEGADADFLEEERIESDPEGEIKKILRRVI